MHSHTTAKYVDIASRKSDDENMEQHFSKLIPNHTQVPNILIDEWLERLNDCEFRIVFIIVRQTFGWVADPETGRRKDRDWLNMTQLKQKTGYGRTKISENIKRLIEKHGIVEATDAEGNLLDTGEKRRNNRAQIFYRLVLKSPEPTLFDKPRRVQKLNTQKVNTQKVNTTKETHLYKNTLQTDESVAPEHKPEEKQPKPMSEHALFTRFFYDATKATRGVKPIITRADGQMLKRILQSGVQRETLEQAATFFLSDNDFRTFSPTIKTLLSSGVITGIQNRMQNQVDFWKKLDEYASRRGIQTALAGDPAKIADTTAKIAELRRNLATTMRMTEKPRSRQPQDTPAFNAYAP